MTAIRQEERTLTVDGECVRYVLERKAIKRVNLRVRRDGSVFVSAPARTPISVIERFLREKADWLRGARARVDARKPTPFLPVEGAVLSIEGKPHTLTLTVGRPGVQRGDGVLYLTLRDVADTAEALRVLRRFVKAEAKRVLTARVEALYPLFAHRVPTFPTLSFRWMRSRWGSCTAAKNHVSLNEKLLFVDPLLADYVILHELCHFAHQDHSAAFYRELAKHFPQYAAAKRALSLTSVPTFE